MICGGTSACSSYSPFPQPLLFLPMTCLVLFAACTRYRAACLGLLTPPPPPALRRLPASPLPAVHDTFGPRLVRCIATTKKNCPVWLTGRRHPRPFHAHCVSTQPGRPHDRRKYRFFVFKNLDNPAVQLQGPFLQDRLIPPPTHRNVIMIAAGTGVNPSEYAAHMQTVGIGVFEYWP